MNAARDTLSALRRSLTRIEAATGSLSPRAAADMIALDRGMIDAALGGGLVRGALHEVFAEAEADPGCVRGVAAAIAARASGAGKSILWVEQDHVAAEIGNLNADGLLTFGIDPASIVLIKARDATAALRVAVEAARCPALGAAVAEVWGAPKALGLSASRRLALAAERSGVTLVLARFGTQPAPSAAETRWAVRASPSAALPVNAPGLATFTLTLLRHRHGIPGGPWHMEWNPDDRFFHRAALPRDLVPVPFDRSAAPHENEHVLRLAG